MNSTININDLVFVLFPEYCELLLNGKFEEAIEFINSNTQNFQKVLINLLYVIISSQIVNSLDNGNYEDCHYKISLLQKINNKPIGFESMILNKDGCIYFRENNFNKAYSLFLEALNKSNEPMVIAGKNLLNSFYNLIPTLRLNKNYQEMYDKSIEIQNTPNTNFSKIEKIIIEFIELESRIFLNLSDSESLANKIIEEIKGENFENKNKIINEISRFFFIKKNMNRAYEIINLNEPNKEPLYLKLKIILSYNKIEELLKNKKNEEAEKIHESIKILDINELNTQETKELYDDLKKILSEMDVLFIKQKIEEYIERNQFGEALSQCDILIKKDKKYEEKKNELIKKQKDYLFSQQKNGKINISDYINKLDLSRKDDSKKNNAISLICEIVNEDLIEDNLDESKIICEKALEKNPKDINLINTKALIDIKQGKISSANNNIDKALEQDPNNNYLKSNKLELIGKTEKLSEKDIKFLKKNLSPKNDDDILIKALDTTLNYVKNKNNNTNILDINNINSLIDDVEDINNIDIGQDNNNFSQNNIIIEENNDNSNLERNNILDCKQILISAKKSELIKESLKDNIKLEDNMKQKISKSLFSSQDKTTQNNLLSIYKKIENINQKDIESPMKIIDINLRNEKKNESVKISIDVLNHFIDNKIEIKEETKESLINYIKNNDYTEDTEEITKEKQEINYENIMIKIKERCNDKIKDLLDKSKNNIEFKTMINERMKKIGINPKKKVLNSTQKEQKETAIKALGCLKNIANSNKGLSEKDLNNLNSLLEKKEESKSKEFDKFLKKETIKIIDTLMDKHKEQKLPEKMVNNISKNIKSKREFKILNNISQNQPLPKEASNNLLKIINEENDDNSSTKSEMSNTSEILDQNMKYEMTYQILEKNQENLGNKEKKIFELEKNNRNIIRNKNEDKCIVKSLENMENLVKDGYINNHTQNTLSNLLESNNEEVFDKTLNVINKMTNNGININKNISNNLTKIVENKRSKKEDINKLLATLVHIVDNNEIESQSMNIFIDSLSNYKKNKNKSELSLAISGLSILSKNHCSPEDSDINVCIDIIKEHSEELKKEDIIKLANSLRIIFDENNINEKTFNKLFDLLGSDKFNNINNSELFETFNAY